MRMQLWSSIGEGVASWLLPLRRERECAEYRYCEKLVSLMSNRTVILGRSSEYLRFSRPKTNKSDNIAIPSTASLSTQFT